MEERVNMSLEAYDKIQKELADTRAEIKMLQQAIRSIRVFEIQNSYGDKKKLVYTDYAQEQYEDLVDRNPHLKFKELEKEVTWDIAEPKGDSDA